MFTFSMAQLVHSSTCCIDAEKFSTIFSGLLRSTLVFKEAISHGKNELETLLCGWVGRGGGMVKYS